MKFIKEFNDLYEIKNLKFTKNRHKIDVNDFKDLSIEKKKDNN